MKLTLSKAENRITKLENKTTSCKQALNLQETIEEVARLIKGDKYIEEQQTHNHKQPVVNPVVLDMIKEIKKNEYK